MDRYKASSFKAFNTKWPERYDASAFIRFWINRYDREILSVLPGEVDLLRVLDIGCATGRLLSTLAAAGIKHLAGVDLAPRMVEVAKRRLAANGVNADLKSGDAENNLPWETGFFDVITLTAVFHHFFRPVDALKEIYRLLGRGGRLIIIDPWFPPPVRQVCNFALRFMPHDGDCHFYAPARVVEMLISQGFTDVHYRRAAVHSFIVVGKKKENGL